MKERVFIMFPAYWAAHLPEELRKYCGRPLRLLKALYGYTYSGKRLYEEQEEFLTGQGFTQSPLLGLWYKRLENGGIFLVLIFADDQLSACTDSKAHYEYQMAMRKRFSIEWHPVATWYLQSQITQDKDKNISVDQTKYSKAIARRYLPNASAEPSRKDLRFYRNPLPRNFIWSKYDNSATQEEVEALEKEFGFRYIEAVGSLIYLSNTAIRLLYAIRKLCRHMHMPGRCHFKACLHLLNHIRCYPTKPLMFYHNIQHSPLYRLFQDEPYANEVDLTLVYFTDSAFADCEDGRSTGCFIGMFQGGVVDMTSMAPIPRAGSSAEAETTFASITALSTVVIRRAYMAILFGDEERPYTVPVFTDSRATIDISRNDRGTARTLHFGRRQLMVRYATYMGYILLLHCGGKTKQLADIGTKSDIDRQEFEFKLSHLEAPSGATTTNPTVDYSRRGVLEIDDSQTDDTTHPGHSDVNHNNNECSVEQTTKSKKRHSNGSNRCS
jgi:hypothetical protein